MIDPWGTPNEILFLINLFNFGIETVAHIIIKYDKLKPN